MIVITFLSTRVEHLYL